MRWVGGFGYMSPFVERFRLPHQVLLVRKFEVVSTPGMSLFVDISAHLTELVWASGISPFVNMPNSETKVGSVKLAVRSSLLGGYRHPVARPWLQLTAAARATKLNQPHIVILNV